MADKLLRSIKFPTLPDRYVIGDSTLTEEGAAAESKAVGDALAKKADTKGRYEDLIVGGAEQLMSDEYETDKDPYLFRPTGGSADVGNREYLDKIVGGTVAWNQLVSESATSVTVQSGHKYIAKIGGTWSVAASSGSAISVTGGTDMLIDLTALFNPTIADYIYSLEQSQAGAGVMWFRKLFPKPYYAYNAGELMSVNTSAHNTVGFNAWDEEWELGAYDVNNGQKYASNNHIRCKNPVIVVPNTEYHFNSNGYNINVCYMDENMGFISNFNSVADVTRTTPQNCHYIVFNMAQSYGTTYNHDICINLSDPSRNGEYEPYQKHTYPLDSSLTLRGVPKLVDGKLAFDGDVYPPSGEVQRRYNEATITDSMVTMVGASYSDVVYAEVHVPSDGKQEYTKGGMLTKYGVAQSQSGTWDSATHVGNFYMNAARDTFWVGFAHGTSLADMKTALVGMTLLYELATPTTETADGYEQYQICDPSGTEEFVTDSIVPVGHETRYPHDLKKKIETAPDSPSTDGTYLMKRSGGKNTYMALPSTPSANGAYVLTLTVSGGNATYSWTKKE